MYNYDSVYYGVLSCAFIYNNEDMEKLNRAAKTQLHSMYKTPEAALGSYLEHANWSEYHGLHAKNKVTEIVGGTIDSAYMIDAIRGQSGTFTIDQYNKYPIGVYANIVQLSYDSKYLSSQLNSHSRANDTNMIIIDAASDTLSPAGIRFINPIDLIDLLDSEYVRVERGTYLISDLTYTYRFYETAIKPHPIWKLNLSLIKVDQIPMARPYGVSDELDRRKLDLLNSYDREIAAVDTLAEIIALNQSSIPDDQLEYIMKLIQLEQERRTNTRQYEDEDDDLLLIGGDRAAKALLDERNRQRVDEMVESNCKAISYLSCKPSTTISELIDIADQLAQAMRLAKRDMGASTDDDDDEKYDDEDEDEDFPELFAQCFVDVASMHNQNIDHKSCREIRDLAIKEARLSK